MDSAPFPRPGAAPGAPFGRRLAAVAANRLSGGYRVFSLLDQEGPEPTAGQFYMLAAAKRWASEGGRAYLPRAISVAEAGPAADGVRLDFLIDDVGPGTARLCALAEGEEVWLTGPLGNAFVAPSEAAARRRRGDPGRRRRRRRPARPPAPPLLRTRRPPPRPPRLSRRRAQRRPRPLLLGRRDPLPRDPPRQRRRPRRPPRLRHRPPRSDARRRRRRLGRRLRLRPPGNARNRLAALPHRQHPLSAC